MHSIISLEYGNLTMTNVDFRRIQTSNLEITAGVVSSTRCTAEDVICGDITYNGGTVTLLNDGYELNE